MQDAEPWSIESADSTEAFYFSEYADQADIADLIDLFVRELPQRMADLRLAAERSDWDEIARLAHQLKGAGGSHGFPQISAAAAQVERAAKLPAAIRTLTPLIERLGATCARTRTGLPNGR